MLHFAWIFLVMLSLATWGQIARGQTTPGYEYLFVVDTSFSMVREKQILAQSLSNLIASGLSGRMQAGDRLRLWTINESVHSGRIPSETWTPERSRALADRAARVLRSQWFEKQTRLDTAMSEIRRAAKAAKSLTVLLLSDGDSPITGTPFDRSINLVYREHYRELQRARKPFVTTLVASEGQFVAWAVAVGGGAVKIPDVPILLRTARLEATNAAPPATVTLPNQATQTAIQSTPKSGPSREGIREAVRSRETQAPMAVSSDPVETKPDASSEQAAAPHVPDVPRPKVLNSETVVTNSVAAVPKPEPSEPPRTGDAVRENETRPRPQTAEPKSPPGSTSALATTILAPPRSRAENAASDTSAQSKIRSSAAEMVQPAVSSGSRVQEPGASSTVTTKPELPPQQVAAVAPDDPASRGITSLLAGLALLAVALGLLSWSIRSYRPRSHPSIISRSFEKKDGRRPS